MLIGVDVREKGSERTVYSLLQIDFRYPGVIDAGDFGERYYTKRKQSLVRRMMNLLSIYLDQNYRPDIWFSHLNFQ